MYKTAYNVGFVKALIASGVLKTAKFNAAVTRKVVRKIPIKDQPGPLPSSINGIGSGVTGAIGADPTAGPSTG